MLDIFVRINSVDIGYSGRDHRPTPDMEGSFVRVTNMDTVPNSGTPYQLFHGVIVDTNGDDVEGGEVELFDYELSAYCNMPQLFGCQKERNA
jgi:hypothetical protein